MKKKENGCASVTVSKPAPKGKMMNEKPKNGQKFKAYEIATGKKAKVGGPFKVKRVTDKKIEAVDRHGWLRVFTTDIWRFEIVGS